MLMKKFFLLGLSLLMGGVISVKAQPKAIAIDDISAYIGSDPYVYNRADGNVYVLNNLGRYERYGVYEKVTTTEVATTDYKVIDYIATDDDHKAYINTGYVHKANTRVVADFEINEAADEYGGWRAVFGSRVGNSDHALVYFYHNDNSRRGVFTLGNKETKGADVSPQANRVDRNIRYILDANSVTKKVTVAPKVGATDANTSIIDNSDATPEAGRNPLFIFDLSTGGDGHDDGSKARMKLYGFRIYEGDILIRNYEPIVNKEGKGGLRDKITGEILLAAGSADFILSADADAKKAEITGITTYEGKMVYNTTDNRVYKYSESSWKDIGTRSLGDVITGDYQNMNNWQTNDDHKAIFDGKWVATADGYKIDPYRGTGGHEPLMIRVPLEVNADYNYSFSASWSEYNSWHDVEMHAYVCNFWDLGTMESGLNVSNSVLATQTFPFAGGTNESFSLDFTADKENQTLLFQFGDVNDYDEGTGENSFWFEFDNLSVKKYIYPEAYPVVTCDTPLYTELDYIESTDALVRENAFTTPYVANKDTEVEVQFQSYKGGAWRAIFCGRNKEAGTGISLYRNDNNTELAYFVSDYIADHFTTYPGDNIDITVTASLAKLSVTASGSTTTTETGKAESEFKASTRNISIFANPEKDDPFIGRIYYIKLSENGDQKYNFKPAMRNDGVYGYYDFVNKIFLQPIQGKYDGYDFKTKDDGSYIYYTTEGRKHEVAVGAPQVFLPTIKGYASPKFTFKSSDESIATVDNDGKVTGLTRGTVLITATADVDNWTASYVLTVTPEETTIDENVDYTPAATYANVTLTRTFADESDTWNTLVLPFDLTDEQTKAAFGNDVKVAAYEGDDGATDATVTFNTKSDASIEANVPVLIKNITKKAGDEYIFNGVEIKTGEAKASGTSFNFVGNYNASITLADGDYFISGNKVYKSPGTTTLIGTRAYLKPTGAGARIIDSIIDGYEETTAIENVKKGADTTNGIYYNVAGLRVAKPTKGLYIVDGKKVIVK